MTPSFRTIVFAASLAFAAPLGWAGDAETDWRYIVALDAGPENQARNLEEVRTVALVQLNLQEKALRAFLTDHPADAHAFEARMRLSRLLLIRGDFENSDKPRTESRQILTELEKAASTPEQHTEVDFAKVSLFMRNLRTPTPQAQRDELLKIVRKFQTDHPGDRRIASLFAETASLFDSQPKLKGELLADAQPLATDEELKSRIADDLKRLGFFGKQISLHFTTQEGKAIDLADYRGKIVVVIFFAAWSPPSMAALANVQHTVERIQQDRVQALGISLDRKADALAETVRQERINWPIAFDGKSWEGPLVRSLGINSLPTLWLVDGKGRLRSLNAVEGLQAQMRQLLDEH